MKKDICKSTAISSDSPRTLFDKASQDVVRVLQQTGTLPDHYIPKKQAIALGWAPGKALNNFAPGKALGGDVYRNTKNELPIQDNRIWYEADIGQDYSRRRAKNPPYRILYSNDGLIYGTVDHYDNFFPIS